MRRRTFGPARRLARGNWMITAALAVVAAALLVWTALLILDRTTIDEGDEVAGAIPEELPDDFPIPAGAEVGDVRFHEDTGQITLELVTHGTVDGVVSTHTVGLVSAGYVVEQSAPDGDGWLITFSRTNLRGTITVTGATGQVTSSIVVRRFAPPGSG